MAERPSEHRSSGLASILRGLVLVGARRPYFALAIGFILVAIAGSLIPRLKISTSRRDLVAEDHPSQKRTVEFDDKFGYPNAPAIVVTGKTKEDRRKVVDAIETEIEALPGMKRRVLGRIGPEDIAEVLLVSDPETISKVVPEDGGESTKQLEKGLLGWALLLDGQLEKGLEQGVAGSASDTKEGFARLQTLFAALDDQLADKGGLARLGELQDKGEFNKGLDELGYLQGDSDHHIIALFPELAGDEGYQVRPIVKQLRAARDRAVQASGVEGVSADVTGLPALVTDELAMIERDLAVTSVAAGIAMILTLYWGFRSFRAAMVSFLPLTFGTIVTFGIVYLVLGKLNLITASFTSVLLGLGDFGVHIQRGFSELLRKGKEPRAAMEEAMLHAGPGLLIGTLSVSVAFLTTLVTEFTAFAELGFIVSVGLVVMLAGTYLLVPPAVLLLFGKKPKPSPELAGFKKLSGFVRRQPKTILIVATIITLFFALWIPKLAFNGRYFDFLPKDTESARGLRALESDELASPFVANVRAKSVEEARVFAQQLRALPTVASVESASDFFPELTEARMTALKKVVKALERDGAPTNFTAAKDTPIDKAALKKAFTDVADRLEEIAFTLRSAGKAEEAKAADETKAQLLKLIARIEGTEVAKIQELQAVTFEMLGRAQQTARGVVARGSYSPDDLPPLFRHRFVSKDGTELALFVHPKGDVWEVPIAEAFTAEVMSVSPETSGIATTLAEHPKLIVKGFQRATILASVLVLVILGISFRRVSDVAVAAVPLAMASIWMLGTMPLLGMNFNHANMVVLPLLLGLGVEAGAHIMSRYRQSAAEHGGVANLDDVLGSTGSAVFVAVLTTIFGFSVMMLAQYRAMFGLGLIMTIGMSATLALSLIVLPAVLVLLKRAR